MTELITGAGKRHRKSHSKRTKSTKKRTHTGGKKVRRTKKPKHHKKH